MRPNCIAFVGVLILGGCQGPETARHADEEPHWAYAGPEGPAHWGELDSEWAVADEGHEQSPVNIDTSRTVHTTGPHPGFPRLTRRF